MTEAGRDNQNGSIKHWKEAIEAKYFGGTGPKLNTAHDFDQLLWRYQVRHLHLVLSLDVHEQQIADRIFKAVSDIPCVLFSDELLKAYPDAKIILTERDEDGWISSMQNSFYTILSWRIWSFVQVIDWVRLMRSSGNNGIGANYNSRYMHAIISHYCTTLFESGLMVMNTISTSSARGIAHTMRTFEVLCQRKSSWNTMPQRAGNLSASSSASQLLMNRCRK